MIIFFTQYRCDGDDFCPVLSNFSISNRDGGEGDEVRMHWAMESQEPYNCDGDGDCCPLPQDGEGDALHYKLRGAIGKKKFFFLIGWRLLIFGRILMKFFVLV